MLLLALLGAASLGGWFVVAPALAPRGATSAAPAEDLDALVTNARAASASERTPPPGVRPDAAAVGTRATLTAAADGDDARCGEDQVPVQVIARDPGDGSLHPAMPVADPDGVTRHLPGEIKSAGVGYTGAMARIDASLRASVDPFDRAMADWLDLNRITPPTARVEALVHDALAVPDPRVYGLAWTACHEWITNVESKTVAPRSCEAMTVGEWARRDPGNGIPWVFALAKAQAAGDVDAQREAWSQLATASRFEDHNFAGAAAVARLQVGSDADLSAQLQAAADAVGVPTFGTPFSALTSRCHEQAGGDAALASTCARVAQTLFEHSDSVVGRAMGAAVHRVLTGDASWTEQARTERKLYDMRKQVAVVGHCAVERESLQTFVELGTIGTAKLVERARHAASAPVR